jgi:hypothetical protein
MFFKIIAAAAIMAAPAVAHAQATTPTVPQDTTRSSSRIRTDSTKVDTSNGSIYTKKKTSDSTKTHTDSTMAPMDTSRMGVPPKNPPR